MYLAANQDAFMQHKEMGISALRCLEVRDTLEGWKNSQAILSRKLKEFRGDRKIESLVFSDADRAKGESSLLQPYSKAPKHSLFDTPEIDALSCNCAKDNEHDLVTDCHEENAQGPEGIPRHLFVINTHPAHHWPCNEDSAHTRDAKNNKNDDELKIRLYF
jgi:hypothetical protein